MGSDVSVLLQDAAPVPSAAVSAQREVQEHTAFGGGVHEDGAAVVQPEEGGGVVERCPIFWVLQADKAQQILRDGRNRGEITAAAQATPVVLLVPDCEAPDAFTKPGIYNPVSTAAIAYVASQRRAAGTRYTHSGRDAMECFIGIRFDASLSLGDRLRTREGCARVSECCQLFLTHLMAALKEVGKTGAASSMGKGTPSLSLLYVDARSCRLDDATGAWLASTLILRPVRRARPYALVYTRTCQPPSEGGISRTDFANRFGPAVAANMLWLTLQHVLLSDNKMSLQGVQGVLESLLAEDAMHDVLLQQQGFDLKAHKSLEILHALSQDHHFPRGLSKLLPQLYFVDVRRNGYTDEEVQAALQTASAPSAPPQAVKKGAAAFIRDVAAATHRSAEGDTPSSMLLPYHSDPPGVISRCQIKPLSTRTPPTREAVLPDSGGTSASANHRTLAKAHESPSLRTTRSRDPREAVVMQERPRMLSSPIRQPRPFQGLERPASAATDRSTPKAALIDGVAEVHCTASVSEQHEASRSARQPLSQSTPSEVAVTISPTNGVPALVRTSMQREPDAPQEQRNSSAAGHPINVSAAELQKAYAVVEMQRSGAVALTAASSATSSLRTPPRQRSCSPASEATSGVARMHRLPRPIGATYGARKPVEEVVAPRASPAHPPSPLQQGHSGRHGDGGGGRGRADGLWQEEPWLDEVFTQSRECGTSVAPSFVEGEWHLAALGAENDGVPEHRQHRPTAALASREKGTKESELETRVRERMRVRADEQEAARRGCRARRSTSNPQQMDRRSQTAVKGRFSPPRERQHSLPRGTITSDVRRQASRQRRRVMEKEEQANVYHALNASPRTDFHPAKEAPVTAMLLHHTVTDTRGTALMLEEHRSAWRGRRSESRSVASIPLKVAGSAQGRKDADQRPSWEARLDVGSPFHRGQTPFATTAATACVPPSRGAAAVSEYNANGVELVNAKLRTRVKGST